MKKGFTLIELLIVIGILAILAVAVILVLNPAEILAQARDSQRVSDLSSVKSAIALYLATASNAAIAGSGPTCTVNDLTADGCPGLVAEDGPFDGAGLEAYDATTEVNGNGWVAINLNSDSAAPSALPALPMDPTNSGKYYYAYRGDIGTKTFELNTRLESTRSRGLMETDGGNKGDNANECTGTGSWTGDECFYEVGTDPGLDL